MSDSMRFGHSLSPVLVTNLTVVDKYVIMLCNSLAARNAVSDHAFWTKHLKGD